jgi:hypothetical protein
VYFQWASTLIIYGWYPEGRNDLAESYLGFLVAITIAIIVITARTEPTYAAEILVLSYIIFGGMYTVMIGNRQHHLTRVEKTHSAQLFALCVIMASAGIYYSWFWIHGIHHNVLETPCGTFGFPFTRVSLYNPSVYKFLAVLSVYLGGTFGIFVLMFTAQYVLQSRKVVKYSDSLSSHNRRRDGRNSITLSTGEPARLTCPREASPGGLNTNLSKLLGSL